MRQIEGFCNREGISFGHSGTGEIEKRRDVVVVGRAERRDVAFPGFAWSHEALAAPREAAAAKCGDEQIGGQAGVTAVAVREGMNPDQPVMKPHGDFIRPVAAMVDPIAGVIEQGFDIDRNPPRLDADIAGRRSIFSGPPPNILKHAPVQGLQEPFIENRLAFTPKGPLLSG